MTGVQTCALPIYLKVSGGYLFASDWVTGPGTLSIWDISGAVAPKLVFSKKDTVFEGIHDIEVNNGYLFIATYGNNEITGDILVYDLAEVYDGDNDYDFFTSGFKDSITEVDVGSAAGFTTLNIINDKALVALFYDGVTHAVSEMVFINTEDMDNLSIISQRDTFNLDNIIKPEEGYVAGDIFYVIEEPDKGIGS